MKTLFVDSTVAFSTLQLFIAAGVLNNLNKNLFDIIIRRSLRHFLNLSLLKLFACTNPKIIPFFPGATHLHVCGIGKWYRSELNASVASVDWSTSALVRFFAIPAWFFWQFAKKRLPHSFQMRTWVTINCFTRSRADHQNFIRDHGLWVFRAYLWLLCVI